MESINISKRNRYMRKMLSHSLPIAKEKDQEKVIPNYQQYLWLLKVL